MMVYCCVNSPPHLRLGWLIVVLFCTASYLIVAYKTKMAVGNRRKPAAEQARHIARCSDVINCGWWLASAVLLY